MKKAHVYTSLCLYTLIRPERHSIIIIIDVGKIQYLVLPHMYGIDHVQ